MACLVLSVYLPLCFCVCCAAPFFFVLSCFAVLCCFLFLLLCVFSCVLSSTCICCCLLCFVGFVVVSVLLFFACCVCVLVVCLLMCVSAVVRTVCVCGCGLCCAFVFAFPALGVWQMWTRTRPLGELLGCTSLYLKKKKGGLPCSRTFTLVWCGPAVLAVGFDLFGGKLKGHRRASSLLGGAVLHT
jgi:hypothetical protein